MSREHPVLDVLSSDQMRGRTGPESAGANTGGVGVPVSTSSAAKARADPDDAGRPTCLHPESAPLQMVHQAQARCTHVIHQSAAV